MITIQAVDFWVAEIPYTSGVASKKHPVLVLWIDGNDVVNRYKFSLFDSCNAAPASHYERYQVVLIYDFGQVGFNYFNRIRI